VESVLQEETKEKILIKIWRNSARENYYSWRLKNYCILRVVSWLHFILLLDIILLDPIGSQICVYKPCHPEIEYFNQLNTLVKSTSFRASSC